MKRDDENHLGLDIIESSFLFLQRANYELIKLKFEDFFELVHAFEEEVFQLEIILETEPDNTKYFEAFRLMHYMFANIKFLLCCADFFIGVLNGEMIDKSEYIRDIEYHFDESGKYINVDDKTVSRCIMLVNEQIKEELIDGIKMIGEKQ